MEGSVSRFCPSCGEELGEHNRYCVKCGSKRKAPTQSPPENIKRTRTLDNFIQEKGKERHGFLKQKKIRNSNGTVRYLSEVIQGQSITEHRSKG